MKSAWATAVGLVAILALVVGVQAQDKKDKEETLKGTITCAKCDLKVEGPSGPVEVSKNKSVTLKVRNPVQHSVFRLSCLEVVLEGNTAIRER